MAAAPGWRSAAAVVVTPLGEQQQRYSSRATFLWGLAAGAFIGAAGAALYYRSRRASSSSSPAATRRRAGAGGDGGTCAAADYVDSAAAATCEEEQPAAAGVERAIAELNSRLQAIEAKLEERLPQRPARSRGSGYVTADSSLPSSDREDRFEDVNDSAGSGDDIFFHAVSTPSLRKSKKAPSAALTLAPSPPRLTPPPSLTSAPEDSDVFFQQIDQLLDGNDNAKQEAYDMLNAKFLMHQDDSKLIWRLSRATFLLSQIRGAQGDAAAKKELAFRARELAFQALGLDESDGDVHKCWCRFLQLQVPYRSRSRDVVDHQRMPLTGCRPPAHRCALTIGNLGDYVSVAEKIKNGITFKDHITRAIELKQDDPVCRHLLGRWCFGVYMITWVERKVASALVSQVPMATVDEALDAFLKAEELKPDTWKENMLFIAKCYIEKRQYDEAASWLRRGDALPVLTADDRQAQDQLQTLLRTYSSY